MSTHVRARLACAALFLSLARPAHAERVTIDLRTAIARARERAPAAIAAVAQIGEARARREGASVRFTQNPEVQLGGGQRFGEPRTLALQAQVSQSLELGRRGARLAAADAAIAHAHVANEGALRELDYEVATIFVEARFADLEVELAARNVDVAKRAAEAAERRRRAGDITDLELNLAKIAFGRVKSAHSAAQAERATAVGRLGAVVGATPDDTIALAGGLRPEPLALDQLRAAIGTRADVRGYEAEARLARAEVSVASADGRPDVGLWFAYQLDESDTIALGGVTLALPVWNRAQADKAAARAKLRRAELQRAATAGAASRQLGDAIDAYARALDAVTVFETEVAPALADSEKLLERSIETGQLAITEYLAIRQEVANSHREYLQREIQLAKAAAAARFIAGVTP